MKTTVPCLLFVVLHILGTSEGSIQFTSQYQGKTVTGVVGSSVNFTWSFSVGVRTVEWGIPNTGGDELSTTLASIAQAGSVPFILPAYTGRVSVSGDSSSAQVMFTLSNVQQNDKKLYGCRITPVGVTSTKTDTVNLVVTEAPSITHPTSANADYNEGSHVNISCETTGKPDADVRWFHNGQEKSSGYKTAHLTFSTISRADAGMYTCRANNSAGSTEKQLNVVVNYRPKGTTITTSVFQNTAVQGQNVTLTCHVTDANPPVSEYKFYVNDSNTVLNTLTNINQYTIHGVERSKHYGKYKCVAHNDVGEGQSDVVVLNITVPANIQSLTPNLTVNEQDPIDLRCEVSGYPPPHITWEKDRQRIQPTGEKLHINNGKRSDSGAYVCIADNGVGQTVQMKTFVTVNYPATILSITSSVSKAWIGQTVTLNCQSDGVPIPTMSWYSPDGTKFNPVKAKENRVDVTMNSDGDFGFYNCTADNGFVPASRTVLVQQIKAPNSPMITSTDADIQATSLTVKWDPPADDGGSLITAYRVVILQGATEIKNDNVTNPATLSTRSWAVGNLTKSTNYTVKVFARNYVFEGNATEKTFRTRFEGVPADAEIIDLPSDTKEGEVTIKWNEPKDNGAPITQYTVYQRTVLEDGTTQPWHKTAEVKDLSDRKVVVKLEKGKKYDLVVTATNRHGESLKEEGKIKRITVGDVPAAVVFRYDIKDGEITLKWEKPDNNGAAITQYSVYQRIVNDEQWTRIGTITDISKREYVVEKVEKGKEYEFAVTATNKYGESSKEDSIKKVKVSGDTSPTFGGINTAVIAGAAAAGVLVIIAVIIFVVWWKRRKTAPGDASPSETALQNNPDEIEGGYHVAAARGLQASAAVAEPDYAQVDVSQKKKNRRPVTDEYAQVDKSKKTKKKPKKQPGELDYAELDDLRPRNQPAPARAATARPVVRPPAYEGTVYADIGVFGLPPPEPTYDNVPKKDVVYSNVESM